MKSRTRLVAFVVHFALAVLGLTFAPNAHAEATGRGIGRLGYSHGGDKLLDFDFPDGSSSSIRWGSGVNFQLGIAVEVFRKAHNSIELQGMGGIIYYRSQVGANGTGHWSRFPFDAMVFYSYVPSRLRVGGGLTYQVANRFRGSRAQDFLDQNFENSLGYVAQAEYHITDFFSVDLRYTAIQYRATSSSPKFGGNNFGLGFSLWLGDADFTSSGDEDYSYSSPNSNSVPTEAPPEGAIPTKDADSEEIETLGDPRQRSNEASEVPYEAPASETKPTPRKRRK